MAQRSQVSSGSPSGLTARGVSLKCPPDFVGQQLVLGEQPVDIAIVDLDGDGDLDLAVAGRSPGMISTAFNHGGAFEPGATYPLSGSPRRLLAGDVDGNGSPDLVVCLTNTPTPAPVVAVLRNLGGGVFAAPVEYATSTSETGGPFSVALADLDADGDRDLAVANNFWHFTPSADVLVDTTVALLLNQGNGTFGAPSESPLGPPDSSLGWIPEASFVVAEDLDGDGDADLALTVGSQNSLYVLENQGAGAFNVSTPYSIDSQPGPLVAADLDGDGDRDLAILQVQADPQVQADTFAVLLNQGSGTFASAQFHAGRFDTSALTCADLDGDGDRDLAFTTGEFPLSLGVVLNQGNGAFDPPVEIAGQLNPHGLASGDLDGNGTIDLASVNSDTVALHQNLGNGAFETAPSYAAGARPRLVANADLDGDGDRELVVGSGTLGRVSVLGNLGSAAFAPRVEYTVGGQPAALTLADLDRDGQFDLVTASGTKATVRLNQGGGILGPTAMFSIGPRPNGVTSADLDGDGDPDLAMSLGSENTLGILRGLGDGSLGPVVTFPSGFDADDITGADFDRDGDVDLMLVDKGTDTARLFDNQGGTFALLASYPAGANPLAITSADFDRDGRVDLTILLEAASVYVQGHAGVLLNQGSGSFGPSTLYPVGREPLGFQSADLDRDGNPDLVVVANYWGALSLLVNRGDGAFASHRLVTTGIEPMGVTCADLDGDGDMDLASTEQASGTVEIHLNRCRW